MQAAVQQLSIYLDSDIVPLPSEENLESEENRSVTEEAFEADGYFHASNKGLRRLDY